MSEEKEAFRRREQLNLPPGYDEAVASSSRSGTGEGSRETSHLLGGDGDDDDDNGDDQNEPTTSQQQLQRPNGYQPPTVRSVRSSFDSNSSYVSASARSSTESLRREIQQMDIEEPEADQRPSRLRRSLSKQLYRFGGAISSLGSSVGSRFGWLTSRIPSFPRIPGMSENRIVTLQKLIGALVFLIVLYAIFVSELFSFKNPMATEMYDPETVKAYVLEHIELPRIRHNLQYLSSFDHVAGTEGDLVLAQYVSGKFEEYGLQNVHFEEYEVYLNYPKEGGRRVAIVDPPTMAWEANIEEDEFYKSDNPSYKQTRVFNGFSKAGNVTGPLIYANYGSRKDFAKLTQWKVDIKGAIVLMRQGGTQGDRALKVKAAHDAGAIGCILYSDPKENGFARGKVWPEGPWSPEDAVERGSVALTGYMAGDPLTPGKPALPDAERIDPKDSPGLVQIPSIPLAWRDAQHLLEALKGHGQQLKDEAWTGLVPNVEWWTGDQKSPKVNLVNEQAEEKKQRIWNVLGSIRGYEQPEKMVIIGNHRDAWCYGAADPMSGTAIMLEIARVFGNMMKQNWRPIRTIEFANWDAEEYNMVGSTEWVEEHINGLRQDGVAYINVDTGVFGKEFVAKGTPSLQAALIKVLDRVQDPITNQSLREIWGDKNMDGLGGGSDYIAFQDVAGTASIDLAFEGEALPLHSCYDNFKWMETFGDPTFEYHALLGKVWALLMLELADSFIVPLNYHDYAKRLLEYLDDLEEVAIKKAGNALKLDKYGVSFHHLKGEVLSLRDATEKFHRFKQEWEGLIMASSGMESTVLSIRRQGFNTKLSDFESYVLDMAGMPGRKFYKSPIFAPQLWSTYDAAYFPGIRDAVDNADWGMVTKQIERVRQTINTAKRKTFTNA